MFLDQAIIDVHGGAGGRGCVAWRREKYEPMGGPNGGNGGRGGDVILQVDEHTDTLSDFASTKRFVAPKGLFGRGQNCAGRDGEDLILKVPPGTMVYERSQEIQKILGELLHHGDRLLIARGGRGGYGNAHFKSSTRQRPDFAELGEPGERRTLALELKLVGDVGIIGYPSVGKSTLISVISSAHPKIGDYPFTTLVPNLGVVRIGARRAGRSLGEGRSFVVCDVPGLIEGASEGKGLGLQFLRHIERCGVLVHLLDVSRAFSGGVISGDPDPSILVADYRAIRRELALYSPALAQKRELVVLNKIDLIGNVSDAMERFLHESGIEIFMSISAVTKRGVEELTKALLPIVLEERASRETRNKEPETRNQLLPVLRPHLDSTAMGAYRIEQKEDQIIVRGKRLEQFTSMTDFGSEGAVRRFRDILDKIGLLRALRRIREDADGRVFIGETLVDAYL